MGEGFLTQRRKGAEKDAKEFFVFFFAPLRLCVKINRAAGRGRGRCEPHETRDRVRRESR